MLQTSVANSCRELVKLHDRRVCVVMVLRVLVQTVAGSLSSYMTGRISLQSFGCRELVKLHDWSDICGEGKKESAFSFFPSPQK